ncbi:MAG: hypothetical protein AB1726_07860 [Planctomycetota bacterium]
MKGSPRRAGFTIIEVVLAMFVLLIGMTTILGLLSFGAATARTAELRAAAANSVSAVLADLQENLFPLVLVDGFEVAGEPLVRRDRPVPGYDELTYSARAVPHPAQAEWPGGALEYRVDVRIHWSAGAGRQAREFTVLLLREVPFGERLRLEFVEGYEPRPPAENPPPGTPPTRDEARR